LCLCGESLLAGPVEEAAVDALVKDTLKAWQVPGVAVAVVHKDKVVYLKGHGVKELGKADPVTPDTLFAIASCSKAFTTTAMAMLVDDGKMAWDDPVRKHVPAFQLSDPLVDAEVTLRDLVSHRTGVRSHDLLWYRSPFAQEERIRRLAHLPVDKPFRASFHYQSSMFTVAGHAVASAGKMSWPDFVRRRVLEPLDMKDVVLTTPEVEKAADHASPHRRDNRGDVELMSWYTIEQPEPAGSVAAGVRDLAKWVRFHLGDGRWDGKRLVSAKNLAETHTPQTIIPLKGVPKDQNPESTQMRYGMGWVVQDYRGRPVLNHGGAIDGFRSFFVLFPEDKLGLVLLNNLDRTTMNFALANNLADLVLGLPKRDWNGYYLNLAKKAAGDAAEELREKLAKQDANARPSREAAAYVGKYEHPAYGVAEVTLENGGLVWKYTGFRGPLEHVRYDTFLLDVDRLPPALVNFTLNRDGEVSVMNVAEPTGVEFTRVKRK
jgi:CubicO group peptidase (beta-lactamase class C family)